MLEKLEKLIGYASSPYYHFTVAAILECKDGTLFEGVNVETSSPQAGICAERNALFQAIAQGYQKPDFRRIYLYHKEGDAIKPCFICRQALIDYCPSDLEIISYSAKNSDVCLLRDLCPNPFSQEDIR